MVAKVVREGGKDRITCVPCRCHLGDTDICDRNTFYSDRVARLSLTQGYWKEKQAAPQPLIVNICYYAGNAIKTMATRILANDDTDCALQGHVCSKHFMSNTDACLGFFVGVSSKAYRPNEWAPIVSCLWSYPASVVQWNYWLACLHCWTDFQTLL